MTDKALEAAVAQFLTEEGYSFDERDLAPDSYYSNRMARSISAYLSALPGEAEVDGEIRELVAWLIERSKPDSGLTFGDNSRGIAEATVTGYDAAFVADHFHGPGAVRLADALQAMQARALAAERGRDALQASHNENAKLRGQRDAALALAKSAEARVKELEEALTALTNAETVSVHVGYDNGPGGGNYIYADAVRTDGEEFIRARAALAGDRHDR